MNYNELSKKLSSVIYLKDDVAKIDQAVKDGLITEQAGYFYLKELQDTGILSLPEISQQDWKELLKVIDESEITLKKSIKFQLYLALIELPVVLILISISLHYKWFQGEAGMVMAAISAIITTAVIHTFFVLRIYQQGATAIERFSEKRVGILFMRIAANPKHENLDKLIDAATLMFLGHHVKPADPFGPKDLPDRIDRKEKDGKS